MIFGQDRAVEQFEAAWRRGSLHHAWLLAGPKGVGKVTFARKAATRVLSEAAGPAVDAPGLETPEDHRIAKLVQAGSHPDLRWLERLVNDKTSMLARNITVDQVRSLGDLFDLTPALSPWRVVVIDSIDDLEKSAANALLKMLEEPPANTIFFLVSHAPGRLLPTIRSRCRRLDFQALDDDAMTSILSYHVELKGAEREQLFAAAGGSAGRALALVQLDLVELEEAAVAILLKGDRTNKRRSDLASELGKRGAGDRYAAFLEILPSLIARETRKLSGAPRQRAVEAYSKVRELVAIAPRLSLDPASTIFQLGGILASVADPVP
ncbi:MAG TPA: DNA polymerase III subunit delta' [Sphingomicrobium sp.]|nr:DNA polymerase III subunit delta' [Sphingomicrobium sp.]